MSQEKVEFIEKMQERTMDLALNIMEMTRDLPKRTDVFVTSKQIIRSATSVAANYRASIRARSKREFFAKLCIVVEECDETLFWLELMEKGKIVPKGSIDHLKNETLELLKILSKARKNSKP